MNWFERLTGFAETTPEEVRGQLALQGQWLRAIDTGRAWRCGWLEIPSLGELRARVARPGGGRLSVCQQVADVQQLHADSGHCGALFQVASQFNLLEMMSPDITPERGVGIYEYDRTQGPACAIAAGAGTIFRNYFTPLAGGLGQSANRQIDCLADLGRMLGNEGDCLWTMCNGYALPSRDGLGSIARRLGGASDSQRDALRRQLRIGLQWHTQVTLQGCLHTVSQAYCSALPVAYSGLEAELWAPFALLVLEAAYEASLWAALENAARVGVGRVFLTLLGGGAFGNREAWILTALERALGLFAGENLEVVVVSYGRSNPALEHLISAGGWSAASGSSPGP